MKVVVLSSGSKGNTTFIESNGYRILIDAGNTCKYIVSSLEKIGVDVNSINAILITHTHVDHIYGLKTLIKKIDACVYITEKMYKDLNFLSNYKFINEDNINIGCFNIDVIKTSHDADDSVGYVINDGNKSLAYITDTGYINRKYFNLLTNKNMYVFESNHDVEMLNNSSYPFVTRQRILSDKGHLSNHDSAKYLATLVGNDTSIIILIHLSQENNTEELAYKTLSDKFLKENIIGKKIIVSKQNQRTELLEI